MNTAPGETALSRIAHAIGRDPMRALANLAEANSRAAALRREAAGVKGKLASLRAQFTSYGRSTSNFDNERRVMLAELKERIREELGEKLTDGRADDLAHARPEYREWLARQHERRKELFQLEARLAQIEADAESVRGEQQLLIQAIRLEEECVRWSRAEMGLS